MYISWLRIPFSGEDWFECVEGVADKRGQFEDGAAVCGGDPEISQVEYCLSRNQVGDVGRSHRIGGKQDYMFGDVGMIYVLFCFSCCATFSVHQSY